MRGGVGHRAPPTNLPLAPAQYRLRSRLCNGRLYVGDIDSALTLGAGNHRPLFAFIRTRNPLGSEGHTSVAKRISKTNIQNEYPKRIQRRRGARFRLPCSDARLSNDIRELENSRIGVESLHTRLSKDTHHLIEDRRLQLMKPTPVLVKTACSALIDEASTLCHGEEWLRWRGSRDRSRNGRQCRDSQCHSFVLMETPRRSRHGVNGTKTGRTRRTCPASRSSTDERERG